MSPTLPNHYEVLNVSPGAEDFVIEAAYRALLKRYHPDVSRGDPKVAEARAKAITEAYQVLKDPTARARYDRDLAAGAPGRTTPPRSPQQPPSPPPRPTPTVSMPQRRPSGLVSWLFIGLAGLVVTAAVGSLSGWESITAGPAPATPLAAEPSARPDPEADQAAAKSTEPEEASAPDLDPVPINTAAGPSFDCRRATTEVLRLICANPELAHADSLLAVRYRDALADSQTAQNIRADQRRWLAQRDATPADFNSLMALYDERLMELTSGSGTSEPIYE